MIKNFKQFNRTNESMDWDDYSKNKDFMEFFNKVKNKILELFIDFKQPILETLIDTIYWCYIEKYSIMDTINYLHTNGDLYDFYVVTDQ
jgi:hypothetical protein